MQILLYNRKLKCFLNVEQPECPTLRQLGLDNVVLAFDQSTKRTGVTIGKPNGDIIGYMALEPENSRERGQNYICSFEAWLASFIGESKIHMLLYEYTFSKGYYNTDVLLSQLRGAFGRVHERMGWTFPMEVVEQQIWKQNIIQHKEGDHSQTKENAHYVLLKYLCPWLPENESKFEDIYDSLCIFYYYVSVLKDFRLDTPINIKKSLKPKDVNYKLICQFGEKPNLVNFSRIVQNRGIRYFNYNYDWEPKENIIRLASHSNDFWISTLPQEDNNWYDTLLDLSGGGIPNINDNFFVMGYRVTKGNFKKILR